MKPLFSLLIAFVLLSLPAAAQYHPDCGYQTDGSFKPNCASVSPPFTIRLIDAATTTGARSAITNLKFSPRSYFCKAVASSGAATATIQIEGSGDGATTFASNTCSATNCGIGTLSPSGTSTGTDSITSFDRFPAVRANLTAVSGTATAVNCWVGG